MIFWQNCMFTFPAIVGALPPTPNKENPESAPLTCGTKEFTPVIRIGTRLVTQRPRPSLINPRHALLRWFHKKRVKHPPEEAPPEGSTPLGEVRGSTPPLKEHNEMQSSIVVFYIPFSASRGSEFQTTTIHVVVFIIPHFWQPLKR